MKTTRVIFLDFDGVLLTARTMYAHHRGGFSAATPDAVTCRVIERACLAGAVIVVSSTWRETDAWKSKLVDSGLMDHIHPSDPITPNFKSIGLDSRPREIAHWLATNPDVTDYRIIDDDWWQWLPGQEEHVIRCHPEEGMLSHEMKSLLDWAGAAYQQPPRQRHKLNPADDSQL